MLEKRAYPANKDGLSLITRSLLFCLLSALWHIRDLTRYSFDDSVDCHVDFSITIHC